MECSWGIIKQQTGKLNIQEVSDKMQRCFCVLWHCCVRYLNSVKMLNVKNNAEFERCSKHIYEREYSWMNESFQPMTVQ